MKVSLFSDELVDPFDSVEGGFVIRAEHYLRYIFAEKYFQTHPPDAEVIYDVGCGNGYGSKMLSSVSGQVIGFDQSQIFLSDAKIKNASVNTLFINYDLNSENFAEYIQKNQIALPTSIVCFETLEHINNPQELLNSVYNLLKKGGVLILSVPNQKFEPKKKGKSRNKFHQHLFTPEKVLEMITLAGFKNPVILGQPFTNFLFHHCRWLINIIDRLSLKSANSFNFWAKLLAFPQSYFINQSYSLIVIVKK